MKELGLCGPEVFLGAWCLVGLSGGPGLGPDIFLIGSLHGEGAGSRVVGSEGLGLALGTNGGLFSSVGGGAVFGGNEFGFGLGFGLSVTCTGMPWNCDPCVDNFGLSDG